VIRTIYRDAGRHWEDLSDAILQKVRFFDDKRGYGAEVTTFLRTDDGGRHWTEAQIPHLRFINRMVFLTPDVGWIACADGKDVWVFRTLDGGHDWKESRIGARKACQMFEISSSWIGTEVGSSPGI